MPTTEAQLPIYERPYQDIVKYWEQYVEQAKESGQYLTEPAGVLLTTPYANAVVNGEIIASKKVIQACQRHLNDLEASKSKDFPWEFDEEMAYKPIEFIEKYVKIDAQHHPFVAQPFQHFIIGSIFGWVDKKTKLRRFRESLVFMGRKGGKALSLDTPIITPKGWRTMADLQIGDEVFDQNGIPTKITYTSPIFHNHDVYNVTFEDGSSIKADAEHLWKIQSKASKKRARRNGLDDEAAYYNATTEELSKNIGHERHDKIGFEYNYRVPMQKPIYFPEKNLPIDPYILGYWLGDGSRASSKITIDKKDLPNLIEHLNRAGYYYNVRSEKNKSAKTVSFMSRDGGYGPKKDNLQYIMKKMGVIPEKFIPKNYLFSSIEQRFELLRGLMDSDGFVSQTGECEFMQTRLRLAENVGQLLASLGIKYSVVDKRVFLYDKDCGIAKRIRFYTDKNNACVSMKRKFVRLKDNLNKRMFTKTIISIVKIPSEPTKCIAVESASHTYLAGKNMTVTHNTAMVAAMALYTFAFDGEPNAEAYALANDQKQSRRLFESIANTINYSPYLRDRLKTMYSGGGEIKSPGSDSYLRALSNEKKTKDGLNVHFAVFDEIHAYEDYDLIEVIKRARGQRKQPLIQYITTAGFVLDGPLVDMYTDGSEVLEKYDEHIDDRTFYFLAEMDSMDEIKDVNKWAKANPNFAMMSGVDMMTDFNKDRKSPQPLNDWITKQFNIFRDTGNQGYLTAETILANDKVIDPLELRDIHPTAGFDLSNTEDFTAVALEWPLSGRRIYVKVHSFIPQARLERDPHQERLKAFEADGDLTIIPGDYVKYEYVYDYIVKMDKQYRLKGINADIHNAFDLRRKLEAYGLPPKEVKQGAVTLSEPLKNLKEIFLDNNVIFDNSKMFRWYLSNIKLVSADRNDNLLPTKQSKNRKIDGFAALLDAHVTVMEELAKGEQQGNVSFISFDDI